MIQSDKSGRYVVVRSSAAVSSIAAAVAALPLAVVLGLKDKLSGPFGTAVGKLQSSKPVLDRIETFRAFRMEVANVVIAAGSMGDEGSTLTCNDEARFAAAIGNALRYCEAV